MINRTFTLKVKSIVLPLYKSLVISHLGYAIPAWHRTHITEKI